MRVVHELQELEALVGIELGCSAWLQVTQAMVDDFSRITGDNQWVHLDIERAKRELPEGTPIVQGLLTLSLVVKFGQETLDIQGVKRLINYGYNKVRFPAPIPVGTFLRGIQTLQSTTRLSPDALRMESVFTVEGKGIDRPVCVAEAVMVVYV